MGKSMKQSFTRPLPPMSPSASWCDHDHSLTVQLWSLVWDFPGVLRCSRARVHPYSVCLLVCLPCLERHWSIAINTQFVSGNGPIPAWMPSLSREVVHTENGCPEEGGCPPDRLDLDPFPRAAHCPLSSTGGCSVPPHITPCCLASAGPRETWPMCPSSG